MAFRVVKRLTIGHIASVWRSSNVFDIEVHSLSLLVAECLLAQITAMMSAIAMSVDHMPIEMESTIDFLVANRTIEHFRLSVHGFRVSLQAVLPGERFSTVRQRAYERFESSVDCIHVLLQIGSVAFTSSAQMTMEFPFQFIRVIRFNMEFHRLHIVESVPASATESTFHRVASEINIY